MEASSTGLEKLRYRSFRHENGGTLEELACFFRSNPGMSVLFATIVMLLASGDLIEVLPIDTHTLHDGWFSYFHNAHDILAIGFVLLVSHYYSPVMGKTLLAGFLLLHLPYILLTFPRESMEHLNIVLVTVIGVGGVNLIGSLNKAVNKAESAVAASDHLARHDPLTDLPNRMLFNEQAQQAIAASIRGKRNIAIIYVDLDHFKDINDSLGHAVGDEVLKTVARRLHETVREEDIVARLGGDEFAIIANDLAKVENAAFLADRLIEAVAKPLNIDGHEINISPSIGIAPYAAITDGETVHDAMQLLTFADMAMYRAKTNGRHTFEFYDQSMSVTATERIALINDLRHAIDRKELVLHYQPQIDMRTGKIIGAEALIRWNHPKRGMVPPLEFIPPAETSGLIIPIGKWVLETACRQAREWQNQGLAPIKMGVNLSPVQLRQKDIEETVGTVLMNTGLSSKYLDLELTESVLMQDVNYSTHALRNLQKLGVTLSIDDFGTGYSSLTCLKQFQVDTLKIDRSFISNIKKGSDSAAISEAVIKLGHSLRIDVLAEGIETEEELRYLKLLGCDIAQGYYYSKPLPAEEFARKLEEHKPTAKSAGLSVEFY